MKISQLILYVCVLVNGVAANGYLFEIGNNDPDNCSTEGRSFDKFNGVMPVFSQHLLIGGKTKSKYLVNQTSSGCFAQSVAFYHYHWMPEDATSNHLVKSRFFTESVFINSTYHTMANMDAIRFDTSATIGGAPAHIVLAIKLYKPQNNINHGTMILFVDNQTDAIISSAIITKSTMYSNVLVQKQTFMFRSENELRFSTALGYLNEMQEGSLMSNLPTSFRLPVIYYLNLDLTTSQITISKRNSTLPTIMAVTAYYRDADLEIGAMSTFKNDDFVSREMESTFFLKPGTDVMRLYRVYHHSYNSNKAVYMATEMAVNRLSSTQKRSIVYAIGTQFTAIASTSPLVERQYECGSQFDDSSVLYQIFLDDTIKHSSQQYVSVVKFSMKKTYSYLWNNGCSYFKMLSLNWLDNELSLFFLYSGGQPESSIMKLDGNNNKIVNMRLPYRLLDFVNPTLMVYIDQNNQEWSINLANNPSYFNFDFASTDGASLNFPEQVYGYGRSCQMNTKSCTLHHLITDSKQSDQNRFFYLVTTSFRNDFGTYNGDDSLNPQSQGLEIATNGGSSSIMIAGNAKFGQPDLSQSFPHKLLMYSVNSAFDSTNVIQKALIVDFENFLYQSVVMDSSFQCRQAVPNTFYSAPVVKFSSLASDSSDVSGIQTELTTAETNISQVLLGDQYQCSSSFPSQVSVSYFMMQRNEDPETTTALFNTSTMTFGFGIPANLTSLRTKQVYSYKLLSRPWFQATQIEYLRMCVNNGLSWNLQSMAACLGMTETTISDTPGRLLSDEILGQTYFNFVDANNNLLQIFQEAPIRSCIAADVFQLTSTSALTFQYDIGKNNNFYMLQSELVTNTAWTDDSLQEVRVYLILAGSIQAVEFTGGKFLLNLPITLPTSPFTGQILIVHKTCSQTYLPSISSTTFLTSFSDTISISSAPVLHQTRNLILDFTNCKNETFSATQPIYEFNKDWMNSYQKQMFGDVLELFGTPVDSRCSIVQWYLAQVDSNDPLGQNDTAFIKTFQQIRNEQLGPMHIDLNYTSFAETGPSLQTFQFSIRLVLRAPLSNNMLSVIHSVPAQFKVSIGCFYSRFIILERTENVHQFEVDFNQTTNTLTLMQPQSKDPRSATINLSGLFSFRTNYTMCGVHSISSYLDQDRTLLTNATQGLQSNPTFFEYSRDLIEPIVKIQYGGELNLLPKPIYLRARTNDIVVKSPAFVDLTLRFSGCKEQPQLVDQQPLVIQLNRANIALEVSQLFKMQKPRFEFCQGQEFRMVRANSTAGLVHEKVRLKGLMLEISSTMGTSFEFGIEAKQLSQNIEVKRVILLPEVSSLSLTQAMKFSGSPQLLQNLTSLVQTIPCLCASITFEQTLIKVQIIKADLRNEDTGTWSAVGKIDSMIVFKIEIKIGKHDEEFSMLTRIEIGKDVKQDTNNTLAEQSKPKQIEAKQSNSTQMDALQKLSEDEQQFEQKLIWQDHSIEIKPVSRDWAERISAERQRELIANARFIKRPTGFKPIANPQPVILKIDKISHDGILKIKFNQPLIVPEFVTPAKVQTAKDLRKLVELSELEPSPDIFNFTIVQSANTDPTSLEYSLELLTWTETEMTLFVNFTDPLVVSQGNQQDRVIAKITNKHLFRARDSEEILMSDRVYIQKLVPPQLPKGFTEEEILKQAKSTQGSMLALVIMQLVLQIIIKGSFNQLWSLLMYLQLVCYLKFYDVVVPANTDIFLVQLTKMVELDLMNPDSLIQLILDDKDFKLVNLIAGFVYKEGEKSILGDLSFFIMLAVAFLIAISVLLVLTKVQRFKVKTIQKLQKIKAEFFYNGLIRSVSTAYLKIAVSAGFQIQLWMTGQKRELDSELLVALILDGSLIVYPIVCMIIMIVLRSKLQQEEVRNQFSNLYTDISTKNGLLSLAYYPITMLRRFLFCAFPALLKNHPCFQLQLLFISSLLFVAFYVAQHPHTTKGRFKIEMVSELLMMILNYHFVCFSDLVIDQFGKFYMGFSFMVFVGVLVLANITNLGIQQFREWRLRKLHRRKLQLIKEQQNHFENLVAKFNQNRKSVLETRPKKKKKQVKRKHSRRQKIGVISDRKQKPDPITLDQVLNASGVPKFESPTKRLQTKKPLKRPMQLSKRQKTAISKVVVKKMSREIEEDMSATQQDKANLHPIEIWFDQVLNEQNLTKLRNFKESDKVTLAIPTSNFSSATPSIELIARRRKHKSKKKSRSVK